MYKKNNIVENMQDSTNKKPQDIKCVDKSDVCGCDPKLPSITADVNDKNYIAKCICPVSDVSMIGKYIVHPVNNNNNWRC